MNSLFDGRMGVCEGEVRFVSSPLLPTRWERLRAWVRSLAVELGL